tara:strand:- start:1316 stop:1519 length:204 start_codon:yes stop_codon:yes gene_type:complete
MIGGGFESLKYGPPEYIVADEPCILRDPNCREESGYVSYVYVMSSNGSIAYREANQDEWLADLEGYD